MGTVGFVDMLLFLRKRIKMILLFAVVGILAGYLAAKISQTYTATVGIEYTYSGAEEQLNPLGEDLDVYEIMQPALVSQALSDVDSDLSVEEVRNQLSVAPVVKTSDAAAQEALIALGENVDVTTTNYTVSYTCDGSEGSEFAQRFLYALLKRYDEQFSKEYLQMNRVPDFMTVVDVQSMDYLEKCDYIESQISAIIEQMDGMVEENSDFTSLSTGLSFAAIRSFYDNLLTNQYQRLYADVRNQLLVRNKELLIQSYQNQIDNMRLQYQNSQDESDQAHEMVLLFYEQYKKNNLYYQARSTQLNGEGENDNKSLVYDYDLSLMINTYDDMLLRYVNSGVEAAYLVHEIDYYTDLITDLQNDTMTEEEKAPWFELADSLLEEIEQISAKYSALANQTLSDYYGTKIVNSLKYNMAVEVKPGVSTVLYMGIGLFIMLLAGCSAAIIVEIVIAQLRHKRLSSLEINEDGTLSEEILDQMSPVELAFYEQAMEGFTEFYLMYQPIVRKGIWEVSETLVRWDSKRFGQVSPDEFIAIAEKYKQMDRLGEWIIRQVCTQSKIWEKSGTISPRISVNYSAQQIESQSFIDGICRIVAEEAINPSNIYLEISGGGELNSVETVAQKITALKALQLNVAIDRFGESISSMRTLYDLPADMVKLDRRFIQALSDPNGKNAAFMNEVIKVCQELDLKICACGVEESWQVGKLEALGIEYQQGFYFSSPLPVQEYERRWMANHMLSAKIGTAEECDAGTDATT